MLDFLKEFLYFLKERKKYWLYPIIIVLALFGILIDSGFSVENIALVSGCYIIFSLVLLILFKNKLEPIKIKN